MVKKGQKFKTYTPDFKISVIMDMREHHLGYRRIWTIIRSKGYSLNHKTVEKIMHSLGLKGKQRKNDKYHSYKGQIGKVAANHLNREFHADKPFEKLTTDVNQFKI